MSLLDEQSLVLLDTPKKLLSYRGQVHVRDLALMLEEVLYYYRPDGELLVPFELEFVLSEYDKWIEHNAVPLSAEVLRSVAALCEMHHEGADETSKANLGYFQQQSMVASMHFAQLAHTVKAAQQSAPETANTPSPTKTTVAGRYTSQWSEIRLLLDTSNTTASSNNSYNNSTNNSTHKPQNSTTKRGSVTPNVATSVAARLTRRQQQARTMHIASSAVCFYKFARWVHTALKTLSERRAEELALHKYLQSHQLSKGMY